MHILHWAEIMQDFWDVERCWRGNRLKLYLPLRFMILRARFTSDAIRSASIYHVSGHGGRRRLCCVQAESQPHLEEPAEHWGHWLLLGRKWMKGWTDERRDVGDGHRDASQDQWKPVRLSITAKDWELAVNTWD